MNFKEEELIEQLEKTNRTSSAVKALSVALREASTYQFESIAERLVDGGKDKALGILLNVCAVNEKKLDPFLLAQTLKVVHNIFDFCFSYKLQDESAIPPLLKLALADDISLERMVIAATLATELTIKFKCDPKQVKKVLLKQLNMTDMLEMHIMIQRCLDLLTFDEEDNNNDGFLEQDVLKHLPDRLSQTVAIGSQTIKRAVPKIGRNQLCPCGSGKKYKKCCYGKDQELLGDSSPFEGLTMTQVRESPELVDSSEIIDTMRAYELKKLNISKLKNRDQLFSAYHRSLSFGLYRIAYGILIELETRFGENYFNSGHLELKTRFDENYFDSGHFEDLLSYALDGGDNELAKEIRNHIPDDMISDPKGFDFRLDLLENKNRYEDLEERCKKSLVEEEKNDRLIDNTLVALPYWLENLFPALSIVFSRAAIIQQPESLLDTDMLLQTIRKARIELDLDPYTDPMEDLYELHMKKSRLDYNDTQKNKEIDSQKKKVAESEKVVLKKMKELRTKENELTVLSKRLENEEKKEKSILPEIQKTNIETSTVSKKTTEKLRRHVENLKKEIRIQQDERRKLRGRLKEEQTKNLVVDTPPKSELPDNDNGISVQFENLPKKIFIPEYTNRFKKSCESLPVSIVAKTLQAVAGFVSFDPVIFKQTKRIEIQPNLFRVRIGINHRLMIHWEKNKTVKVIDIINRADFETWLKQFS